MQINKALTKILNEDIQCYEMLNHSVILDFYKCSPKISMDVERSFIIYKHLLSDKR